MNSSPSAGRNAQERDKSIASRALCMGNSRHYTSLILLLVLAAVLPAQAPAPPLELAGKIPLPDVKGRIDHLAADVYTARLFVAALGNNSVEVLDVRSNAVIASLSGLAEPQGVAYVKSANRLFVANGGDGTLRTYDGSSLQPIGSVRLGSDADNIRVDEDRNRFYVGYGDGAIAVLDAAGKRVADIPLKAHPEAFQLAEKQAKLFVNLPDAHSIAVLRSREYKVAAEWPVRNGAENFPMAIDEANKRIFVVCRRPARLLILDMDSGLVLAHLPAPGDADDIFYDPIHARLYVTGGEGRIAVYAQHSSDSYSEIGEIPTVAGARTGLFVPEWNRLFVAVPELGGRPAEIRIYRPR
jgi:YVTN family beta-propeller protein